jgi:AraC-like DNA-binding protein/mannose-6-phosphate isomerase-like protein (cupin superfamily)
MPFPMTCAERGALYQSFLPDRDQHAYVWKYSQAIGGRRPRHFHGEPEMNLIVRGSATFGIGDVVVETTAGELLTFPPGQDHALLEASPDLYLYAIGMDPAYSSEVLRAEAESVAVPLRVRLEAPEFVGLARRAEDVVDRIGIEQRGAELWEHAYWLARRSFGAAGKATHVLTRRTLQILRDDPHLDLDRIARKLRTPASEVSRHFHRDASMTLVRYRSRLRLLRLIHLVDGGGHNLMTSAVEAGFGSYSQCHRIFRSELGCSPRQFFASGLRERMQRVYSP